ncbi:MAG: ComF family protein [bacterium]|nr:ComF family protein [bacterium]
MYIINPQILSGPWDIGYTLDELVVLNSQSGRKERTEIAEASYQLKFMGKHDLASAIAETIKIFMLNNPEFTNKIDCLVGIPPSNLKRDKQPVIEICKSLSSRMNIEYTETLVSKVIETPEIKDLDDSIREQTIKGVFRINNKELQKYKSILIIDDLYSSGATAKELVNEIRKDKKSLLIYLITLIKSDSACMRTIN